MNEKKELIDIINSIKSDKAIRYITGFVKVFLKRYMYFKDGKYYDWTKEKVN